MRRLPIPPLMHIPLSDPRRFYAQAKDILRVEWLSEYPSKRRKLNFSRASK